MTEFQQVVFLIELKYKVDFRHRNEDLAVKKGSALYQATGDFYVFRNIFLENNGYSFKKLGD